MDEILTVKQAAEKLQMKRTRLIYEWLRTGKLKGYKLPNGRNWRIKGEDLEAVLQEEPQ